VVLITGEVGDDVTPGPVAAGAAAYIQKPFNLREIVAEVGRQLGRCDQGTGIRRPGR